MKFIETRLKGTCVIELESVDAERAGLMPAIVPLLEQLQALCFRVAPHTRATVLKLVGE